eukprot:TRINITY_DN2628_c0_g1_i1.p1 TRINITY_DN2628_c0_g1~~TRINITY_DN2628_c0_g1_i1.p1  ORF type:complete len:664 (-),score=134.17 TRINITY_DN2628_c0_g1_i1:96-2087(-)
MASPKEERLETQKWFHPKMTRQESEDILRDSEPGTFVVRPSSKSDCFALTYKTRHRDVVHSLIQKTHLGFKLPEEDRVYPTVSDLLRTCKFLTWEEPPSDANVAILTEAFPSTPLPVIIKALQMHRNDVTAAIDFLLTQDTSPSPPQQTRHTPQNHQSEARIASPFPNHASMTAHAVNPIEQLFKNFSKVSEVKNLRERWPSLERSVQSAIQQTSPTLESNLLKILQNTNHPMGKKVDMFLMAFKTSMYNYSNEDIESFTQKAVGEINTFLESMRSNIISKVQEFNVSNGPLLVWKILQTVVISGAYSQLYGYYQQKFASENTRIEKIIQNHRNITLQQLNVPQRYLLGKSGSPYSKGIETLRGLSYLRNVYDKLNVLVLTCTEILDSVREYYSVHSTPEPLLIQPSTDDLIPLLTFVMCRAQVPNLLIELSFLKDMIPEELKRGFEGFALCAFDVCLRYVETVPSPTRMSSHSANVTSQRVFSSQNLMSFESDFNPREEEDPSDQNVGYFTQDRLQPLPSPPQQSRNSTTPQQQQQQQHQIPLHSSNPFLSDLPSEKPTSPSTTRSSNSPRPSSKSSETSTTEPNKFETLVKAEKSYVKALKQMNTIDSYNQLAVYYNTKGKYQKAIQYCNQVLLKNPENDIARKNLDIYLKCQSEQRATAQ